MIVRKVFCFIKRVLSRGDFFLFIAAEKPWSVKFPRIFLFVLLPVFLCVFSRSLLAATTVSSVKVVSQNTGVHTAEIYLNLNNESGVGKSGGGWVWVFVKYSADPGAGSRTWSHCTIATSGHTAGGATTITIPSDQKGAFIEGSGTGTKLVWEYGTDGLADADVKDADFKVRVFVIDMIKIPTGSFEVGEAPGGGQYGCGDPNATLSCQNNVQTCSNYASPMSNWYQSPAAWFSAEWLNENCSPPVVKRTAFTVGSESQINLGYMDADGSGMWTTGDLIMVNGGGGGDTNGPIPAAFPKGYNSFYFMEHELSQGQYRDFLNTLTRTQQQARVSSDITGDTISNSYVITGGSSEQYRIAIRAPSSGNGTTSPVLFGCDLNGNGVFDESADGEWVAIGGLSWADLLAYADWAGLRPMTELEYEKAARYGRSAVFAQYPWGDSVWNGSGYSEPLFNSTNTVMPSYAGTVDEQMDPGWCSGSFSNSDSYLYIANWYSSVNYPNSGLARSGAFYGCSNSTSAYSDGPWGGYDLVGNAVEMVVTVGTSSGRGFAGTPGDGALTAGGEFTNADWSSDACGWRGGGFGTSDTKYMRIGGRYYAAMGSCSRNPEQGGRLARTSS